ncbi:MAG: aspartate-semialdehyde dehydrogenase [Oscillospiraceae bacterium]|nr:aspartate-semialdehyde dehydrogenase [Oscillospiraceae bacterium]
MEKKRAGVIGATGMVGQRLAVLLARHPWFEVSALAASARSAGRTYAEAVSGRWAMDVDVPENLRNVPVLDASADFDAVAAAADFVFCAVDMKKEETRELEERLAKAECPVISNNSANRGTADVPMLIPEINAEHAAVIEAQRKRLGTERGFIAVKSNCSIQSYVPLLHPLLDMGLTRVHVCTYQAVSGASKTLEGWPEMRDNVIPYIGGEEEKSEREPMKVWGRVRDGAIIDALSPVISAQCLRVPVSDGHMAAVFAEFDRPVSHEEIVRRWRTFSGKAQELELPSAPKQFIHYFEQPDRPQTRLERDLENGMAVSAGRLRVDEDGRRIRFIGLSHNTLRGAAGGGVLMAELLAAEGIF